MIYSACSMSHSSRPEANLRTWTNPVYQLPVYKTIEVYIEWAIFCHPQTISNLSTIHKQDDQIFTTHKQYEQFSTNHKQNKQLPAYKTIKIYKQWAIFYHLQTEKAIFCHQQTEWAIFIPLTNRMSNFLLSINFLPSTNKIRWWVNTKNA